MSYFVRFTVVKEPSRGKANLIFRRSHKYVRTKLEK